MSAYEDSNELLMAEGPGAIRQAVEEAEEYVPEPDEGEPQLQPHPGLKVIEPNEVIEDPGETTYTIKPTLAEAGCQVIAGPGGTAKSISQLDLTLCCTSEKGLWLERFEVIRRPVLYVDFESGEQRIYRRLHLLARVKDYGRRIHKIGFIFGGFPRTEKQAWDRFCLSLVAIREEDAPPPFVIIDPWGKFSVVNENDNAEINKVLVAWVDRITHELGSPVSIVHHTSVEGRTRGATALPDGVETAITLSPGYGGHVWRPTKVRDAPFDPFVVKVEPIDGGLSVYATDLPRHQGDIERIVRRLIGDAAEPLTIGALRDAIKTERGQGVNAGTVEAALNAMDARPVMTKIRGRKYQAWTLRERPEER
ncbi:MAG: AAA family ATPase [Planctomycetes bacterium]|nr:AAA family ATPase [Planctomycetota bacterium]